MSASGFVIAAGWSGMTQQQLGDIVGIKFQQIQKYETGMNRISASRLWDIAQALDVPISFFFEGFEGEADAAAASPAAPPSAAIFLPTRRRWSLSGRTTRSRRRSVAGCSISPASSATWPEPPRGRGGLPPHGPAQRWACPAGPGPLEEGIDPAPDLRGQSGRSMKTSCRAPGSSTSSPFAIRAACRRIIGRRDRPSRRCRAGPDSAPRGIARDVTAGPSRSARRSTRCSARRARARDARRSGA